LAYILYLYFLSVKDLHFWFGLHTDMLRQALAVNYKQKPWCLL